VLVLKGHAKGVFHVAYSPDGTLLATSSRDGTVRLWDAASGAERRALKGHTDVVYSSAFSPDGKLLASAGADQTVKIWAVDSGREVRTLTGHAGAVYHTAFSPDGKRLATAGEDRAVRLWDVATGAPVRTLEGHSHRITAVCFRPDGRRLASACPTAGAGPNPNNAGGEVKVWDVAAGCELFTLPGDCAGVLSVAFSPDGKRLAGAGLGRTVKVWEAATGQEALALAGHTLDAYCVAFSPDGRRLASSSGQWSSDKAGEVKVWDLTTGAEVLNLAGHAAPVWTVAFSPDGKRLAAASGKWGKDEPGEVKVWDLDAAGLARPMPPPPLTAAALDTLWGDLASPDPHRAYRAVVALGADPGNSVPYLLGHAAPPGRGESAARVAELVRDLDADSFETRERASAELAKLGPVAHAALRKALESPSPEVRRRAARLLPGKGDPEPLSNEELRALRAVEALQRAGTPDVRPALQKLAAAGPGSPVGQEAAAALEWLDRRAAAAAGRATAEVDRPRR
jgi:WD40 repeat protein